MENNLQINSLSSHSQINDMVLVSLTDINRLNSYLVELIQEVKDLKNKINPKKIYNNQDIKNLLDIKDKVLKKYRDEGILGFHRVGDKFWYTQEDIDKFLINCYLPPFKEIA